MHIGMFEVDDMLGMYWERKLVLGLLFCNMAEKAQEEVIFPWNLPYCIRVL